MAEDRMAVLDMLRKATADGDVDVLREGVRVLAEAIMEAEVSELTGAAKGERAPDRRLTNRNGYRERRWDTRVGTIGLSIPKVRDGGRVVSMAALVAVGVASTGERRILGLELAAGNDEGNAWAPFLRGLVERGLAGVRLVISDAHRGLVAAVRETLLGAAWQRCRVHFTRNAQALVPRRDRKSVV